MANFCSKCGTQAAGRFCPSCGAAIGGDLAPPPMPAGAPAVAAGSSSATKVILIVVAVAIFLGAIGVGGLVYVGYRAKQKLAELNREYANNGDSSGGFSSGPTSTRVFSASKGNGCQLLEGREAAGILGIAVDRVESAQDAIDGSESCRYWINVEERKRLARAEIVSGINEVGKGDDKNAAAGVEKLIGGALGALGDAQAGNNDADFAFSIELWRTGGKAQWQKLETAESDVKGATGIDFGALTGTQHVEGLGDRSMVLPAGHSIMVLKGDSFFLLGFQQFVPGREKTTALARAVAGRL
jgi:hypothetical protein